MKEYCRNHPLKKALSFCHICREYYCEDCLEEGVEYYYCKKRSCQEAKHGETSPHDWVKGVEYATQGKFNEAKEEFEKALKADPYGVVKRSLELIEDVINQKINRKVAIHMFNGAAHSLNGRWNMELVELSKAIEIDSRYNKAYNERGRTYHSKGQYDQAIADYNKAIELNPRYVDAYYNRGNAYFDKGQNDKAMADYNKAIELNPKNADAYNNRGNAKLNIGQYDKAIADFNKTVELNPKDAEAFNNRGLAYEAKCLYDKAIADYKKSIELNPLNPVAYYNRGRTYCIKGQHDKAWNDVEKVQALGFQIDPEFLKILRKASGRES